MPLALQNSFASAAPASEVAAPEGPLLRAIQKARTNANLLFAGGQLNAVADRIAATAVEHGHRYVYGGSTYGHMLVGALVSRCSSLTPWVPGTKERILLIDGPLVGTAGLAQAAQAARAMGAVAVDALTAGSSSDLRSTANSGIDRLWVLDVEAASTRVQAN